MNLENKYFKLRLVAPDGDTFKTGRLELISKPIIDGVVALGTTIERHWQARSGLKSWQDEKHCWTSNKGRIPPSRLIKGVYQVNLNHYFSRLSNSQAFMITPSPVLAKDGNGQRSELMLHRDAGKSIGSNGCIVLWDFEDRPDDEVSIMFGNFVETMAVIKPIVGDLVELEVL